MQIGGLENQKQPRKNLGTYKTYAGLELRKSKANDVQLTFDPQCDAINWWLNGR